MIHLQSKNILAGPPGLTLPRPLPTTGVPLFPHNPATTVVPPTDPRLLESKPSQSFSSNALQYALKIRKKCNFVEKTFSNFFLN